MEPKSVAMKRALRDRRPLFGLFCCLPVFQTVEAIASSGFDFFVFDAEHSPTSVIAIHSQLMAISPCKTASVVRIASHDPVAIKHYLDLGVDALMIPNVQNADQMRQLVRYTRYPPEGIRGIGGSVRVSNYFRDGGYYATANDRVCIMAQIESPEGLNNIDEICAVDGLDVVFFGPNDFAAQSGLMGQPGHADIVAAMERGMRRVKELGKASGILCGEGQVERYLKAGTQVVAVGSDIGLLVRGADELAKRLAIHARA